MSRLKKSSTMHLLKKFPFFRVSEKNYQDGVAQNFACINVVLDTLTPRDVLFAKQKEELCAEHITEVEKCLV
jgi:hypothetical protein